MYTNNPMYEVKNAIEACKGDYNGYKRQSGYRRSNNRQWDYIICKVCIGCGKPLSRYDNLRGYAFCFKCRKTLFPETIDHSQARGKRFRHY